MRNRYSGALYRTAMAKINYCTSKVVRFFTNYVSSSMIKTMPSSCPGAPFR